MKQFIIDFFEKLPEFYPFEELAMKLNGLPSINAITKMVNELGGLRDTRIFYADKEVAHGTIFDITLHIQEVLDEIVIIYNDYDNREVDFIYVPKRSVKSQVFERFSVGHIREIIWVLEKKDGKIIEAKSGYDFTSNHLQKVVKY